jgi:hypothetical protein
MTQEEERLVRILRIKLLQNGYPKIYVVDHPTLEAVEKSIMEHLESLGEPPIVQCGKNGVYFKGCELVIRVN